MKNALRFLALAMILALLPIACFPAQAEKTDGVVRVLLTRLNLTDRVEIALDGSYTLNELSFQRGSHLIVSCKTGSLFVYYEGMALNVGGKMTLVRHETDEGLENGLRFNGAYELHPGDLTITVVNGQLQAVLYAPVEEYLLGVVPYEMSDSFPLEALKAQAVAARTYALRKVGSDGAYDVVDNTNDQAYFGVKAENVNAARAVRETAGLCGYYKDALAECFYSASNGGQTELVSHVWGQGDYGYLAMVEDPYDLENPESVVKSASLPKKITRNADLGALEDAILSALSEPMESLGYDGSVEHIRVTGIESMETALPMYSDSPSRIMTLLRLSVTVQGRRLITVYDDGEEEAQSMFSTPVPTSTPGPTVAREEWTQMQDLSEPILIALDLFPLVESALDLSINGGSNEIITVRETDSAFVLESRRYGHGVGMSQRGAQQMAGVYSWTYDQILRFYYPGMTVKKTEYTFALPTPLSRTFLSTPGPAATPTPRPTLMPVATTPGPQEYKVKVLNIGVNSYLNLRAAPNTQAAVVRQLYYGQELIVVQDLGDWLQVKTDDVAGFVMAQFVVRDD